MRRGAPGADRRIRPRWWLIFVGLLFAAACSNTATVPAQGADGDADASESSDEPVAADDATPPPEVDDGERGESARPGRDVPPLVLPTTPPGSDDAYNDLLDDLDRFITDEQRTAGVPWPTLRTIDPVTAYRSCAEFQNWMSENNTTPSLVEAYTAPASPERGWDLDLFGQYSDLGVLSTPSEPPYEMRVEGVVHPAATDITDGLLAQVPAGSVAIVYWDSVGSSELIDPNGLSFGTSPGWTDVGPWVAIMAPTDVGWQVWWDELTEVPPPGLDRERGLPQTDEPRRDM